MCYALVWFIKKEIPTAVNHTFVIKIYNLLSFFTFVYVPVWFIDTLVVVLIYMYTVEELTIIV